MNLGDQYKGNFLEALLLPQDRPVAVTISKIAPANSTKCADGRPIDKPILYFEGKDRGLILAKTNARAIARKYGPSMDAWIGKEIQIYQARITAFGTPDTPAIRIWGTALPTNKKRK